MSITASGRPNARAVTITTTSPLPRGRVGVAYSKALAATGGGPYTWSVVSGALPAGLSLSGAGLISGTPAAGGTATFTVKAVGAGGAQATKAFTLVVDTVWIATPALPSGQVGKPYAVTLAAGGSGPFAWSLVPGSTLPAGLSLAGSTGTISGTPTVAGSTTVKIKVVGAGGKSTTKQFTLKVTAAGAFAITTTALPAATTATAYSTTLVATGTGTMAWTISAGKLPTGLTLAKATGIISGTPTGAAGTSFFTVKLVRGGKTATQPLSITVGGGTTTVTITTTNLPNGTVGVAYTATLTGTGPTPYTWSIDSGSLPAGLALNPSTGAISGTPTVRGTASFTVKLTGSGGATATKTLSIVVTAAATTEDWTQSRHDAGHSGWSPNETVITPSTAANVHEEWSVPQGGPSVIAGGTLYTVSPDPANSRDIAVVAYDLSDGTMVSRRALDYATCGGGGAEALAATANLLVTACSGGLTAVNRAAPHAVVWSTRETDPSANNRAVMISGNTIVSYSSDQVTAYRLSDGQRIWQSLLPSGSTSIWDVAVSGSTVVVNYYNRIRGLSLATGAQTWTVAPTAADSMVASTDGWIYLNKDAGVARLNAATGVLDWAVRPGSDIYRVVGADGDTVYVWEAVFNFGPPSPSNLIAVRPADGSVKWTYPVPSRVRDFAVTGDVIWVTSSEIYSQGQASNLIALNRTTGAQLKDIAFAADMFGYQSAFGNGKIAFEVGGGLGSTVPHRLAVFGRAAQLPTVDTRVLPLARPGQAYSTTLTASGGRAPYTWSVASGSLSAGLSLSSGGTISGTTSVEGTSWITVKATDANGAARTRRVGLSVLALGTASWTSAFGGPDNNPFARAETAIDVPTAGTLAYRFGFGNAGSTSPAYGNDDDAPLIFGNRAYIVREDGLLAAYDLTGMTANRPPLWTAYADPSDHSILFQPRRLTSTAATLVGIDYLGRLVAIRASDGASLWRTDGTTSFNNWVTSDGSRVYATTYQTLVALDAATGTVLWTVDTGDYLDQVASDGTRVYANAGPNTKAYSAATGAEVWSTPLPSPVSGDETRRSPILADGTLYVLGWNVIAALDPSDGAMKWRTSALLPAAAVVVGDTLVAVSDNSPSILAAYSTATGEVLWSRNDLPYSYVYAASDLVITMAPQNNGELRGYDRTTGELLWNGGSSAASGGPLGVAISGGRIYVSTREDGVRAFGPLS